GVFQQFFQCFSKFSKDRPSRRDAPKVSIDRTFIPVATSQTFNLTCLYDSRPTPMIEWFMSGYKIDFDNPKNQQRMKLVDRKETENSGSSTIIVADVKKDDFGNYTCRAVNKIGTGEATAVVSGYPDRPTIQVEIDPNGESAIIHLQAKSIEPVVDFQLDIM
uniref:Ig-like domain-containing protein n=1 Tax=Romanomermis culicivorax TaxID=13658 RepID=A0A915IP41_ROMCU